MATIHFFHTTTNANSSAARVSKEERKPLLDKDLTEGHLKDYGLEMSYLDDAVIKKARYIVAPSSMNDMILACTLVDFL